MTTKSATFPTFAEFLHAITGHGPFPWQERLASYVEQEGVFPDAITVQTGLGKTTSMLVHLHALARDVHHNGVKKRTVPLRCFHVVERREVVDTSFILADSAAKAVNEATDPASVLYPVREALSALIPVEMAEIEPVVSAVSLHGGIHTRGNWLRPVGAQLVTATVTQIVSRALFRGVGVSQNTSPMHAAVTGMDRVIFVDEPHLSEAAIAALKDAENVQRDAHHDLGVPVGQTVILGATAPPHLIASDPLTTNELDAEHPVAGSRLRAPKTINLVVVDGSSATDVEKKIVAAIAQAALDAHRRNVQRGPSASGGKHGVLVYANTVKTAQKIFAALLKSKECGGHLRLVHGRLRREERPSLNLSRGDITVATQTLEVGPDIDGFEVVTQPSSLSSLIQRAGRCNRYGELPEARVLVFAGRVTTTKKSAEEAASAESYSEIGEPDAGEEVADSGTLILDGGTLAVYGERATSLLVALNALTDGGKNPIPASPGDIGVFRKAAIDTAGAAVLDPPIRTAVLRAQVARFAAYTDPGTDFPLSAFLSGPDTLRKLDVAVAWRDSDSLEMLDDVDIQDDETVQVSLRALRDLLEIASSEKLKPVAHLDDIDTGSVAEVGDTKYRADTTSVLKKVRVRSARGWLEPKTLSGISPGSLVVLDTTLGGYVDHTMDDAPGFDPQSRNKVSDVSKSVACRNGRGRFLLTDPELTAELSADFEADSSGRGAAERVVEALREDGKITDSVRATVLPITVREPSGSTEETKFRFVVSLTDGSVNLGKNACRTVFLADHGHQVGQWSKLAAEVLPLRPSESDAVAAAGHLHDLGKTDRTFQASMGHSGAPHTPAWAKSSRDRSVAERRRLREQAGLSSDWRHEVASATGIDNHLIRHLVVSHHMWGRPLIVHPDGEGGPDSRITAHVEVFDTLTDMYGPWGLALLETVMRWADHRASEHPRTYGLNPIPVAPERLPVPGHLSTPVPAHQLPLPGLTSSPMAGTLAAIGLLERVVGDGLDPNAVIRWEPGTNIPVIGTSHDVRHAVDRMTHDVSPWLAVDRRLTALGGEKSKLKATNAKVPVPDHPDLSRALRSISDDDGDHSALFHQLLPDTQILAMPTPKKPKAPSDTAEGEDGEDATSATFRLHCMLFPNNGTPFTSALVESTTEHFFDPTSGYAPADDCKSGGLDVHPDMYPERTVRRDTLSWALAGIRALGWGAANTVDNRTVVLPTPSTWTTLAGYRALALCGGLPKKGPHLAWKSAPTRSADKLKVWVPLEDKGIR
jgi:CRISPR-associated endonuclease/helicase Cas3